MHWRSPYHGRWLAACLLGLGVSAWAGGFSLALATMFLVIFTVGAALIADEDLDGAGQAERRPIPRLIRVSRSDSLKPPQMP